MGRYGEPDWDGLFMEAALQPETWIPALGKLASFTGASHGQLIGVGGGRELPFNLVSDFNDDLLAHFIDRGWVNERNNFRIAASQYHIMRGYYDPVLHEQDYDEVIPGLETPDYVDWCEEIGIPFGCQTNLVVDKTGLVGLATLRSRRDGRSTREQRQQFERAAAAARRAVRLQEKLEGEQVRLIAGAFDAIGITAFVIDARGHLLAHSLPAERLLASGLARIGGRMLKGAGAPLSLRDAVQALIAPNGARHVRTQLGPDSPVPVMIEGFRLPERDWSLGKLPHGILIANAPKRDRAGILQFLAALYKLSPAEADIAVRLFDGRSRYGIAADRDVTIETLRGQIKQIYQKCGVEGEAALMRLLAPFFA